MGSCVSVHKKPESTFRLRISFGSKNVKRLIPRKSPTVNAEDQTIAGVAVESHWSRSVSKEEAFFDSQPWLDSDCEDDFVSVRGDFTPSRGSTPVHPTFSAGMARVNDPLVVEDPLDSMPAAASTPDKKKRLSDLFKESLHTDQYVEENTALDEDVYAAKVEAKGTNSVQQPKSTNGTPRLSGANSRGSSDITPNGLHRTEDEPVKSTQCCLPRLRSSHSFSDGKKSTSTIRGAG